MNKHLRSLFIFAIVAFIPSHAFAALSLRDELLSSIVQIVGMSEDGEVFIGSGTTISQSGLVLTNYHVITDKSTNAPFANLSICYTVSQFELPRCIATAKIIAGFEERDLAIIMPDKVIAESGRATDESFQEFWKQTGQKFYTVPFKNYKKNTSANILDKITVWGYPVVGESTITVTSGLISGFTTKKAGEEKTFVRFMKTDTAINPGNSGGAAFNKYFSFIGVPSNAWPGQLGFIIPVEAVVEWFKDLDKNGAIAIKSIESMQTYRDYFVDIDKSDPFYDVAFLMKHFGIMGLGSRHAFFPDRPLTRAEAIQMIVSLKRIAIPPASLSCAAYFKQKWFADAVCFALENAWIEEKNYGAEKAITKAEFSSLLSRTLQQVFWRSTSSDVITRREAAQVIYDFIAP